jgi:phosphoserine phosphatase
MLTLLSCDYIFIDLDGTLIHADLTQLGVRRFTARRPWRWLILFFWFLQGRARLKPRLAERVEIDPATLPYCPIMQDFIARHRAAGKKLILATASPQKWADAVGAYLGCFDRVMATGGGVNLRGPAKLRAMHTLAGGAPIAYAGNSWVDEPVFQGCHEAVLIHGPGGLEKKLLKNHPHATVLCCPA